MSRQEASLFFRLEKSYRYGFQPPSRSPPTRACVDWTELPAGDEVLTFAILDRPAPPPYISTQHGWPKPSSTMMKMR